VSTDPSIAAPAIAPDHGPAIAAFRARIAALTAAISAQLGGRPVDAALDAWLNAEHGAGSASFAALRADCEAGVAAGWLCTREGGGIRYGRIFKPADDLHGHSVDVVDMTDIAGPHHVHPNGEIDLIVPIDASAQFDGRPAGWLVCPPGSAHRPTVSNGRALVLYLLPAGSIEFTQ
jgi:Domain of unknown function (DUF4863)